MCEYCATGDSHQCAHYAEHGITGLPGGFAEYITVPAVNTVRIDRRSAEREQSALAEPLGCIVHSCDMVSRATRAIGSSAPDPAHGVFARCSCAAAGPPGLLFIQYLRRRSDWDGPACS